MRANLFLSVLAATLVACGGGGESTTPDESRDLDVSSGGGRSGHVSAGIPPNIDGTRWRWVEAHCTEGPLDLASRGYTSELTVRLTGEELLLVRDQEFAAEECQHTVLVRARPGQPDWHIEEIHRIAVPANDLCYGRPEQPRPGEVRMTGQMLEVLVQRSHLCNGLEVRMVYAPLPATVLSEEQIIRRYAAFFSHGDASAIASLFAETGNLLEPFTRTETGDPYPHSGRLAVRQYYQETFETAPWRSMRITEVTADESQSGGYVMNWEYMDPRLESPLAGLTRFTIAAGEIFEARIELTTEPAVRAVETPEEEAASDG